VKRNIIFGLSFFVIASVILLGFSDVSYGAQTVNDRKKIVASDFLSQTSFEYNIKSIGDLDGDGVVDLSVISGYGNTTLLILFMNNNGTVRDTNEINMDVIVSGIGGSCIGTENISNDPRYPTTQVRTMEFVGDLDGDGMPTLALGAAHNKHNGQSNAGAVYMVELDSDGTVDSCFTIVKNYPSFTTGFDPAAEFYSPVESVFPYFGEYLVATDLNGDGQNELIVGASNSTYNSFLWPLFLNSTGGVSSHPTTPLPEIRIGGLFYHDLIDTLSGGEKIVISNSTNYPPFISIVTLNSTGGFVSSNEIATTSLGQLGHNRIHGFEGVAALGDMDGDGSDDIMVGNTNAGDNVFYDWSNTGEAYILYLNANDTLKEFQKISNESEFARTGIIPFGDVANFGRVIELWTDINNNAVIAMGALSEPGEISGRSEYLPAMHMFYVERALPPIPIPPPNPDEEQPSVVPPTPPTPILSLNDTVIVHSTLIQQHDTRITSLESTNNNLQDQLLSLEVIVSQLQNMIQLIQNPITPSPPTPTVNATNPQPDSLVNVVISANATDPHAINDLFANAGNAQVTLHWTEPGNGGAPITSYYVWWFDGTNNKQSTYYGNSDGPTLTLTGLVNGEQYRFKMTSINAIGQSNASNEAVVIPTIQ